MDINKTFNLIADKVNQVFKERFGLVDEDCVYIYDQYKIIIIKLSSILVPLGIKMNENLFKSLDEDNLKNLIEILIKKFSFEVFNSFDRLARDLYNMFELIKKEIPDEVLSKIPDNAIKNLIIDNLKVAAVSGHSVNNFLVVKTTGMLESFQVFILDNSVKDAEIFKRELNSLFNDFYINYLQTIRLQKQVIIRQVQDDKSII
ncbi:MAG: hypothetical protein A2Y40_04135 [Candidatus Margulisbacteria bacterium GWF2_35_9]|nr:MAG: hypothetical protein A2Y40_04135 [Candidatus Margulisbacteria bacterium GWF2_35_9]